MIDSRYIVDVIGDVVANVRIDIHNKYPNLTDEGRVPYYMYGHPREISRILDLKDKNAIKKFRKFPLIALFTDITESHGNLTNYGYTAPLNLLIVTDTVNTYTSEERYENSFKPKLYPIYDLFMNNLASSQYMAERKDQIQHTKTDRLYWGSAGIYGNEGLIFNDYLDAIEINIDSVKIVKSNFKNCGNVTNGIASTGITSSSSPLTLD